MGKDVTRSGKEYCCCRMFLIYHGVYLIALHCLLQSAYGVGVVVTSSYKSNNNAVNYTTIASNLCLVPTGIFLFWANLYEKWKSARAAGVILMVVTLFNLATATAYFAAYVDFRANSLLDRDLFWGMQTWVNAEDVPFTVWHVIAVSLIFVNALWFYYAYMTCRVASLLRTRKK